MRDKTADEHDPAARLMSATMPEGPWTPRCLNEDFPVPNRSHTRSPRDVGHLRLAEIAPAAGVRN